MVLFTFVNTYNVFVVSAGLKFGRLLFLEYLCTTISQVIPFIYRNGRKKSIEGAWA